MNETTPFLKTHRHTDSIDMFHKKMTKSAKTRKSLRTQKASVKLDLDRVELYAPSLFMMTIYTLLSVLTLGVFPILLRYHPWVYIKLSHRKARVGDKNLVVLVKEDPPGQASSSAPNPSSNSSSHQNSDKERKWKIAKKVADVDANEVEAFVRLKMDSNQAFAANEYETYQLLLQHIDTLHGILFEYNFRRYLLVDPFGNEDFLASANTSSQPLLRSNSTFTDSSLSTVATTELQFAQSWILCDVEAFLGPKSHYFFEIPKNDDSYQRVQGAVKPVLKDVGGLSQEEAEQRTHFFGINKIDVSVRPLLYLFFDEILHPFFQFQTIAVIIWILQEYILYAICILVTSLLSALVEANEIHVNSKRLAHLAALETTVTVVRDREVIEISSKDIALGDIVVVQSGENISCDLTLLRGSVLVNEASLTGESAPIRKSPWSPATVDDDEDDEEDESAPPTNHESTDLVDELFASPAASTRQQSLANSCSGLSILEESGFEVPDFLEPAKPAFESSVDHAPPTSTGNKNIETQPTDDIWTRPQHTLYAGTYVLQVQGNALALVTRVRSSTVRGELVRDIIKESGNLDSSADQMHKDAFAAMGVLFAIGCSTFVWSIFFITREYKIETWPAILDGLDLLTIAVPPALPAAVTFGLIFAIARLKQIQILCVRASAVTKAAWLKIVCFDKTGTLTEEGLDVRLLHLTEPRGKVDAPGKFQDPLRVRDGIAVSKVVTWLMACCHSVARVDGELLGDEVDVRLFAISGWHLDDVVDDKCIMRVSSPEYGDGGDMSSEQDIINVLRTFEFNSQLARMAVLGRIESTGDLMIFCKGAPEVIVNFCRQQTIPKDLSDILSQYTQQGYRVLGIAARKLQPEEKSTALRIPRTRLERDMDFLGLVILENRLKPDTAHVINQLSHEAEIRCIMVTGDHSRTAMSVARQCGIMSKASRVIVCDVESKRVKGSEKASTVVVFMDALNPTIRFKRSEVMRLLGYEIEYLNANHGEDLRLPLGMQKVTSQPGCEMVITGAAFRLLLSEYEGVQNVNSPNIDALSSIFETGILKHTSVFARMAASDKTLLVKLLKEKSGLDVGMCGDGANDAGALKEAHVGVSLCTDDQGEAAASLAAPLTSRISSIGSVTMAIREGRAAASASIAAFKFMFLYSMIQLLQVCILYVFGSDLTDGQFLIADLFLTIPLGIFMGDTHSARKVTVLQPPKRLATWSIIFSCLGQTLLIAMSQATSLFFLRLHGLGSSKEYLYQQIVFEDDLAEKTNEVTTLFLISTFQYIIACSALNIGRPFREEIRSNLKFFVTFIFTIILGLVLLFFPPPFLVDWLGMMVLPFYFRLELFAIIVVYAMLSYFTEFGIINVGMRKGSL